MSALLELAERCEKASFPCPDDASAAEIVAIKSALCHLIFGRGYDAYSPDFTNSLDDALMLVPEGMQWRLDSHHNLAGVFDYRTDPESGPYCVERNGEGATPALALCAAALRARAEHRIAA